MARITVKTDGFAKRIIKNGERAKRRSLFRMASAARNELRNVVRKRKGASKADGDSPPNDHGVYRNTALFSVSATNRGFEAGFADYKAKGTNGKRSRSLTLGNKLAQDTLEFGGSITRTVIYKDKSAKPKKETFQIKARPHVFTARQRLYTSSTKNQRRFIAAQQYLIDRGYLK
tara:strand:- start:1848 stop:2369 length:522 start_codon:yes stop_codon:yes gene_type:complete